MLNVPTPMAVTIVNANMVGLVMDIKARDPRSHHDPFNFSTEWYVDP